MRLPPLCKGERFLMDDCISGWTILNSRPAIIRDIYQDARVPHDRFRTTFVKSLIMMPIRSAAPVGAIGVYWAKTHEATKEEVDLLFALADSASAAIESLHPGVEPREAAWQRKLPNCSAARRSSRC